MSDETKTIEDLGELMQATNEWKIFVPLANAATEACISQPDENCMTARRAADSARLALAATPEYEEWLAAFRAEQRNNWLGS